jgi:hypothetical protein
LVFGGRVRSRSPLLAKAAVAPRADEVDDALVAMASLTEHFMKGV